jgi:NTE family protein
VSAQEKYNYGICLSGGGALGYAHVGVLQALHEHGIEPEIVSGSSMGAIIGTLYAAGYSAAEMLEVCKSDKMYEVHKLIKPTFSRKGFASHKTLRKLLHDTVPHDSFEELKHKLHICVTNISDATYKIVDSGNLHDYVVASASIPGIFEINYIDEGIYVDGGVLNNLPAEAIRKKCHVLIGVDVVPLVKRRKIKHTTDAIVTSIRTLIHANSAAGRKLCDHLIISPAIEKFHEFNFEKFETIYQIGYDAANEYIAQNPEILKYAKT